MISKSCCWSDTQTVCKGKHVSEAGISYSLLFSPHSPYSIDLRQKVG